MSAHAANPVLELSGIAKSFFGVRVLQDVGLRLFAGEELAHLLQ